MTGSSHNAREDTSHVCLYLGSTCSSKRLDCRRPARVRVAGTSCPVDAHVSGTAHLDVYTHVRSVGQLRHLRHHRHDYNDRTYRCDCGGCTHVHGLPTWWFDRHESTQLGSSSVE